MDSNQKQKQEFKYKSNAIMNTNESKKSRSNGNNSHNSTAFSGDNNLAAQLVHAPAVAVADNNSNRSMMDSSSGGRVNSAVKFAMPAKFVAYEPRTSPFGGKMISSLTKTSTAFHGLVMNNNGSAAAPIIQPVSGSGGSTNTSNNRNSNSNNFTTNNSGAYSSGSLSSMGNYHASGGAGSSSLSLSSGSGSHSGSHNSHHVSSKKGELPPSSVLKQQTKSSSDTSNLTNNSGDNNIKIRLLPPSSSVMTTVDNLKNNTSSTNIVFSNSQTINSGVSSGSGSDNNGGATSSSGNAAVVTTVVTTSTSVTCNNNSNTTTSSGSGSGDDDRSSSGSGRGSGSGSGSGNRRSAGEASGEFYYAGYSSNQATSSVGDHHHHHHHHHHPQGLAVAAPNQANGTMGNMNGTNNTMNMPSFASFRGASLAASNAAAAVGRPTSQPSNIIHVGTTNNNNMGTTTRHVSVAATDDGPVLRPSPTLRVTARHHNHHHNHSSHNRYHHNHRRNNVQGQGGGLPVDTTTGKGTRNGALPHQDQQPQAAVAANAVSASRPTVIAAPQPPPAVLNGGIPSAIDGPSAAMPRPQSSEQVHSQQVQLQQYRGTSTSHAHHVHRHHRHHNLHQQQPQSQLHHELRLPPPPIDDQAVLQRVPRTHAAVVAHDLPPPPTSSDAWSSGSSSPRSRALAAAGSSPGHVNSNNSHIHAHPMVASVRLANGGAVDSVNMSDGSSPSPSLDQQSTKKPMATAMHVTMDDPILRKKIMLKHQHQLPQQPMAEAKKPSPDAVTSPAAGNASSSKAISGANNKNNAALKRKISAMQQQQQHQQQSSMRGGSNSDDSFDSAKSRSGSDEGYAASSEHQSGSSGSGSDSISSDDANKKDNVASSSGRVCNGGNGGGATGQSKGKAGGASAMADTSSMSSSVLADFSSVMNEEGTISLSRSESPRSSCTSLSSNGDNHMNDGTANNKGTAETENGAKSNQAAKAAKSSNKRDSTRLLHASSANNARKRSKQSMATLPSGDHAKTPSSADVANGFGSTNNAMMSGLSIMEKSLQQKARSSNHHNQHHHYHSRSTGRKMLEKSFLSAKRDLSTADAASALASLASSAPSSAAASVEHQGGARRVGGYKSTGCDYAPSFMKQDATSFREASIYSLGQDVMAQVVQFLEPPEIHSFLTTPLSKTWLVTYTAPQELWKILCTAKPFYAKLDEGSLCGSNGSSDGSTCSFPICNDLEMRHLFGRYRLLYTSFVRCMKYLNRLQDDALNGRAPTGYTSNETQNDIYPYHKNVSLKAYFAKARRLVRSSNRRRNGGGSRSSSDAALSITSGSHGSNGHDKGSQRKRLAAANAAAVSGKTTGSGSRQQRNGSGQRFGSSMLTDRLLRPTQAGYVDNVNLPWSCAIYSVVNWMVAFADVEGIQIMCLKCLPYLLEDESQRTTAQRAGLTDSVLRAMVLFPDSIELHTVAFHTLVLLARPLGGNEGMLFHTAMVNTRGIFNNGSNNSKNGIVIMLDSMRRFAQDEILQAMSCWSLVNVALTPLQKSMLVKLGGLTVTSNAMLQHPYNAEVQFRALFALINLVIPTETRPDETEEMREFEREIFQQLGEVGGTSEKEMLDASVGQISNIVVVGMKNFCSSEAILNRACLVLHNLSLNEEYHSILLWTPNCYQMLEWCLGNYPHDHVLQQSAGGTIQRLNATLSADEELRARFTHSIRSQQQHSLELARQEAVMLQEQQREQEQAQMDVS